MPSRSERGTVVRTHKPSTRKAQAVPSSARDQRSVNVQVTQPISGNSPMPTHAQLPNDDQRSPDVIQTFLFSAISTILWMRDLLPDEYFRTAFYATINKHCSYRDFTHGSDDADTKGQADGLRPKGYHLRVLKRNTSTRGNQMIEWLESGIFESIRSGYLSQLQIAIFADSKHPTEVLELYCFHFRYLRDSQNSTPIADLVIKDFQNKRTVSLKDTREALSTVVKNMVGLNGTMPHLPERCFMSPYLVWNEHRPSGYQPPGFHSSNDMDVSFPTTTGWAMGITSCGQVRTDLQCIDLVIAYTQEIACDENGEAIVMPDFVYGEQLNRLELSRIQNHSSQHENIVKNINTGARLASVPSSPTRNSADVLPTTTQKNGELLVTIDSTQDQEDLSRLKALQSDEMYRTNDTQLVRRPTNDCSQMMVPATAPSVPQENHGDATPAPTSISQAPQSPESVTISCECGIKEDGNTIQCNVCKNWQHLQCYAYEAADALKSQAKHSCYTCLTKETAGEYGDRISRLTRTRQVIHCIRMRGLTSSAEIAKTLGYHRNDVEDLLRELKQRNIIVMRKTHKKSRNLTLNSNEASQQALLDEYLNPAETMDTLVGQGAEADGVAPVRLRSSSRKRKDHGYPDGEGVPKTPRLSRAYSNLAFDSNFPFTPDRGSMGNQGLD